MEGTNPPEIRRHHSSSAWAYSRLCAGEQVPNSVPPPDFVVPLAGAYVIAASEWLDFEGAASPSAMLSLEQEAQRAAHIEMGADRAFILTAALPLESDERIASLYRVLLLAGLAELGHKQTEFRHWLRANEEFLFPAGAPAAQWDSRCCDAWSSSGRTCCAARGPRAEHAMEIVASIREPPIREPAFMARWTPPTALERFSVHASPTEAATELLSRLHGERSTSSRTSTPRRSRGYAGGDLVSCELRLAVRSVARIVAQRTAQLGC